MFAHAALCCMAATAIPDIASMDIQKRVLLRNALRGPFASSNLPYATKNAMETGLTNVIANG